MYININIANISCIPFFRNHLNLFQISINRPTKFHQRQLIQMSKTIVQFISNKKPHTYFKFYNFIHEQYTFQIPYNYMYQKVAKNAIDTKRTFKLSWNNTTQLLCIIQEKNKAGDTRNNIAKRLATLLCTSWSRRFVVGSKHRHLIFWVRVRAIPRAIASVCVRGSKLCLEKGFHNNVVCR